MIHFLDHFFLVLVTAAYIGGILLAYLLPCGSGIWPLVISILPAAWLTAAKKYQPAQYCLLLCFVFLGYFNYLSVIKPPESSSHIYNIAGQHREVVIVGWLDQMAEQYEEYTRLIIRAKYYRSKDADRFKPAAGLIAVKYEGRLKPKIRPGTPLICRVNLSIPKPAGTPGLFNYKNYLAGKNIFVTAKISSPLLISSLDIKTSFWHDLSCFAEKTRSKAADFIIRHSREEIAPVYQAILTGSRAGIPPDLLEGFRQAGVTHILAISGLHLSILAGFLYSLFRFILSRSEKLLLYSNVRKLAGLLTIFPLIFYVTIAGGNAPVVRAFIMTAAAMLALLVDRRKNAAVIISFAALLILLPGPAALLTSSFQLSFAAIIFILASTDIYQKAMNNSLSMIEKARSYLLSGLTVSVLAVLGTAPILLFYFNRLSLISPLSNLIIEPLICMWSLPLGFISLAVSVFNQAAATFVLQIGTLGIDLAIRIIMALQNLHPSIWLPTPHLSVIFAYYASLVFAFLKYRQGKFSSASLIPFLAALFLIFYPPQQFINLWQNNTTISCIDVGQGNSTLISTPKGRQILIDGGGGYSTNFNVGKRVIAPYLWHLGIKKVDQIIITHPDSDHYNGIEFLLDHFNPQRLWVSGVQSESASYNRLLSLARSKGVKIGVPEGRFMRGRNWQLTSLKNSVVQGSDNDSGLIIRYDHQDFSMLFPGDITSRKELELADKYGKTLQTTLLLSPHHGSKYSSSRQFLHKVSPEICIVSSGRSPFFPADETMTRLRKAGIKTMQTKRCGTIVIKSSGKGYRITTTLPEKITPR
ncbi:MAG: DNA internalization-related competence protein ComEC/Rec2 [Deltaproteobacteria bacterium]|nr:MAG: DNA internalization-related competence protein ComEC/Rec2 [Deltaproteobacteria bacterium]